MNQLNFNAQYMEYIVLGSLGTNPNLHKVTHTCHKALNMTAELLAQVFLAGICAKDMAKEELDI